LDADERSFEKMPARETDPERTAAPEIIDAHAQIFVTDIERAVAFYRDRLGFSVEYLYGEPRSTVRSRARGAG
jgi:predicted enzyme related to lactoylglutathione lyase